MPSRFQAHAEPERRGQVDGKEDPTGKAIHHPLPRVGEVTRLSPLFHRDSPDNERCR
jgi:hypothetical protein